MDKARLACEDVMLKIKFLTDRLLSSQLSFLHFLFRTTETEQMHNAEHKAFNVANRYVSFGHKGKLSHEERTS